MNNMTRIDDTSRFKELQELIKNSPDLHGICPDCKSNKIVVEYPQREYPSDFCAVEVCLDCGTTITC